MNYPVGQFFHQEKKRKKENGFVFRIIITDQLISPLEFLVRGIDKSQLDMTVIVPATRENVWSALRETLELSYKAILRCTEAPLGSTDDEQLETSIRSQFFVAKGQAQVFSTLEDWEDEHDFDRWPLEEILFHPDPDRDPFLTAEGTRITFHLSSFLI